jgi:hypothetical protein
MVRPVDGPLISHPIVHEVVGSRRAEGSLQFAHRRRDVHRDGVGHVGRWESWLGRPISDGRHRRTDRRHRLGWRIRVDRQPDTGR